VSEPKATADQVEQVLPGLWRWWLHDERTDFIGAAYAVDGVLIDPLPLVPDELARLGDVTAIVLTAGSHQRSSWRYRRELGVPVWAPALVREVDEEPDTRYGDGDELPGGLRAVFTPGAGTTQHTLLLGGEPSVAICPDLLLQPEDGELGFVPDEYLYDPAEARRSIETLLTLPFDVLALTHGGVLRDDPKAAIRALIAER
jgi:metallo-beta-lactamase superfamily protein